MYREHEYFLLIPLGGGGQTLHWVLSVEFQKIHFEFDKEYFDNFYFS